MTPVRLAAAALALALSILPAAGRAEEARAGTAALPTVSVITAAVGEVTARVVVTGTLVARERVAVTPGVDGLRIESLSADAGDTVAEGEVLARLAVDTIEVALAQNASQIASAEAQIAQAKAQILSAEATARQARLALERARTLTTKGVSAQDVLDQRQAAADSADAQLAVARQALSAAEAGRRLFIAQRDEQELRRGKTEIRAPRAGLVLSRNAVVGQVAAMGGGALYTIAEGGDIELDAEVPETVLPRLAAGDSAAVLAAGMDAPVAGRVRLVMPEVDATTRLGRLRISLPAGAGLRAGAFARATIVVDSRHGLVLPVSAVNTDGGASTVQLVREGVIVTQQVTTGLSEGARIEIVSGLAAGDVVVARAGTFLRDGDRVRTEMLTDEEVKG